MQPYHLPTQAVILVGGLGTRLGDLTKTTPKPLLDVAGRPFLEYLLWNLRRYGINRVIFASGYLAHQIESYFGDGSRFGLNISYCTELEPLGTAGALRNALPFLDDWFFALNGDTLFDANYFALPDSLHRSAPNATAVAALRRVPDVSRFGFVTVEEGRVSQFDEKGRSGSGLINAGIYLIHRSVIESIEPNRKVSLESEIFPRLVHDRVLNGIELAGYFLDIGLPHTLEQAQTELPRWQTRPIAFLDRDGVINKDTGYLNRPEDCQWIDGAVDAIRSLNETGYLVVVVTNQAGIARGYYTEDEFRKFMSWYSSFLAARGAHLDDVFYCPDHATEGIGAYRRDSDRRKPNPGMLLEAIHKWKPDLANSFLIGDKESDLQAANAAGIPGFHFTGGNLLHFLRSSVLPQPAAI